MSIISRVPSIQTELSKQELSHANIYESVCGFTSSNYKNTNENKENYFKTYKREKNQ